MSDDRDGRHDGGSSGGLDSAPRIARPDDFYARLLEAHRDLSEADSRKLNARLILLLANQVGDMDTLERALAAARAGLGED